MLYPRIQKPNNNRKRFFFHSLSEYLNVSSKVGMTGVLIANNIVALALVPVHDICLYHHQLVVKTLFIGTGWLLGTVGS